MYLSKGENIFQLLFDPFTPRPIKNIYFSVFN
jgi:hypothetical protein